jgi:hypothetical protein
VGNACTPCSGYWPGVNPISDYTFDSETGPPQSEPRCYPCLVSPLPLALPRNFSLDTMAARCIPTDRTAVTLLAPRVGKKKGECAFFWFYSLPSASDSCAMDWDLIILTNFGVRHINKTQL